MPPESCYTVYSFKIAWRLEASSYLYALITVVGGDNPVLGEDQVDGVAGFPSLQVEGERSVGLCVPLSHLFKPVENIA